MKDKHHIAFDDIVQSLDENKDKIALIDREGNEFTYGQFKRKITGSRAHLESMGVKKGTKVLVFVTMSMELYAVLEALFSLGAVILFLDPWMKGRKMQGIIRDIQPELLILNKKAAKYSWLLSSTWKLKKWKIKELPENNDEWKIVDVSDNDSALITFTSGSTGKPKGANRTFDFIDAQAKALKEKLIGDQEQQNVDYTNLPIVALAGFAIGNTVVIPKINLMKIDKARADELINHLHEVGVTRLVVSPALLSKILKGIKQKGKGQIQKIVTGGAAISIGLVKDCIDNHPDIEFEAVYGSTEAEPISSAPMREIYDTLEEPLKGVYVGKIASNLKMKIISFTDKNVDQEYFKNRQIEDGEIGEIVISGRHVNSSYYKNPEAFARYKFKDEKGNVWHRTGDMGYLNGDDVYLVGRENRIMKKQEQCFYPFPMEQYIEQTFGLTDIGYIQSKSGDFVLFVGSDLKAAKEDIIKAIHSIDYPIDEVVFLRDPLPRDPRHRSKLMVDELNK